MATTQPGQNHDRSALVLYGTETGNSEECAEELGRVFERIHFSTCVSEMDQVEINILPKYTIVVFVISTTGQGEFPRNARKFWKSLLRKRLPPNCLGNVNFTTFGLGDSSYSKFNWTARKLHKRLDQLGGKEVYPRGEADDQHEDGWDGTFLSWKVDLNKHILKLYPLPDGEEAIPITQPLPPKYLLEIIPVQSSVDPTAVSMGQVESSRAHALSEGSKSTEDALASKHISLKQLDESSTITPPSDPSTEMKPKSLVLPDWLIEPPTVCQQLKDAHPDVKEQRNKSLPPDALLSVRKGRTAELIQNKRVTPKEHWQDVRELTFTVDEECTWNPGDVMTIHPKNFPEDVQTLIDLQGWNSVADTPLRLNFTSTNYLTGERSPVTTVPDGLRLLSGSTLRDLLTNHLDITALPKRNFLQNMSYFTTDETHRERLQEFCLPLYTDEFFDYTTRPRRSILEVLADFPTVRFPWNQAAWLFPLIRGRQFSITTAPTESRLDDMDMDKTKKVELLVAIVKYKTILKKIRQGLCSRYLAALPEGTQIQVSFDRPSDKFFDLAFREPHRPVLMVAAGTGIAPCRALVWERANYADYHHALPYGETTLVYGGRNKGADFFYGGEWEQQKLRTDVKTAFSRDQKEKIYVQDVIRANGELVNKLFDDGAVVYICGSAGAMPKSVKQAFLDVLMEYVDVGTGLERDMEAVKVKAEKILDDMVKQGRYIEETW